MDAIEFDSKEKELINKLRERVYDVLPTDKKDDDLYIRKWLKARNFDLDKAEDMLKKHIKFMTINGLDKIKEDFIPKEATKYFHTARLGYDKEGSVVRILHLGASDLRGLALSVSKNDAFSFATYLIYTDIQQQKVDRAGKPLCDKQVYVFDLNGLNWASIIHRTVAERAFVLLKNYEANHPENLKRVYVVHAPSFFSFIYNWLKTFVPESILSKVEIVPADQIQSVITKNIDPSILPASVGGTKIDESGDPNCASLYNMPLHTPVPESLMLYKQLSVLENDPTAKRTIVECGNACRIRVPVKEPNSLLKWDFQTSVYDISFGLCFKEDKNADPSEIISIHRVESHRVPETGVFSCPSSGLYELIFDNTYSWMTNKEVIYKIEVVPPKYISYD